MSSLLFQKLIKNSMGTKAYSSPTFRYPAHILTDKIYRSRENLSYCKEHGIPAYPVRP